MIKIINTQDSSNIHKNRTNKNELHFNYKKKRYRNVIFLNKNNLPKKNDNFNRNELIYNFNDLNKCCQNQLQISAKINNYVYG